MFLPRILLCHGHTLFRSDDRISTQSNIFAVLGIYTLGPSVRVVEPFVRHSRLGVNLYAASNASAPETENNSVRLRYVLDLDEWERQTTVKINFAPLESWDHFISDTPRKLILVDRECADDDHGCMHGLRY